MKLMIASDIHGSAGYCRELMDAFEREAPDRLLLLGDILYHGPRNGLPDEHDPKEVARLLNGIRDKILCVRGNCDAEIDQMVLDFPIMAEYCILWLEETGRMIFATHGHHFHKDALPPLSKGDILLHGHTHVPAWEEIERAEGEQGSVWYLNPGSTSFPKEHSPHSYMIMEEGKGKGVSFTWKQLETQSVFHELKLD